MYTDVNLTPFIADALFAVVVLVLLGESGQTLTRLVGALMLTEGTQR